METQHDWHLDFAKDRYWICDNCGQVIHKLGDGRIEWITFDRPRDGLQGRGIRLVHKQPAGPLTDCGGRSSADRRAALGNDGSLDGLSLQEFTPPNGLMTLIGIIIDRESPVDEVLEIMKRLYVPGYEEARPYFAEALKEEVTYASMPPGCYRQTQIQEVIEWAARKARGNPERKTPAT